MGIIIRQSVKSAIWSYLGIVIGYINVGIIMPQFFDTAQIGLVNLFASVSLIFAQFGTLGFTSVINRLFPVFRNQERKHNGFLFLATVTGGIGFILCLVSFFLLKPWIIETNIQKSPLLVEYLWLLMPLVLMRLLFTLLDNYNKMLYDAVTGTFWIEFVHKLINLGLIVVFAFGWLGFSQFFFGYIVSMSIPVFPVIWVLMRRKHFNLQPRKKFLSAPLKKEIRSTMFFGFINGLAGIILVNVDKVFVNQYLSLKEVGVFSVCALFASLIRIPYTAVSKIATGIIAEAWKRDDRVHIRDIYQKAAVNQAIIGMLIFTGILVNIRNIFEILPPEYSRGKWVLIIYSAGMLVNTVIGLAGNITETSRYFRFTTLFWGISILLQFGLSFFLIPTYGIIGAALATMITLVLNSTFHAILQRTAFGIYGMNGKLLIIGGIGLLCMLLVSLVPAMPLVPDIIIRSSVVSLLYLFLVRIIKLSLEMNELFSESLKKILSFLHVRK
jgi:O-antigen/teichoic acid export membrane protein